jgi:hypothetical protein
MDLVELQAFLGIEERYKRWQDFKRTLKRQQNIVHKYTDLRFTFDGLRTGRSITRVRFNVRFAKTQQGTLVNNEPQRAIEEIQLANELRDAGYQQDAYDAVHTYGTNKVRAALKQARAAQKAARGTKSEIRNLGGFIHYLLQTDVDSGTDGTTVTKPLSDQELNAIVETLLENYEQQRDEAIELALQELDNETRDQLSAHVFELLNPFEVALISNDNATFTPIRNRYIIANELLSLPERFKTARKFYHDKDFGYDTKTNERIRNSL